MTVERNEGGVKQGLAGDGEDDGQMEPGGEGVESGNGGC